MPLPSTSLAVLTRDGSILVAGCDRCDYYRVPNNESWSPSPWGLPEYRVELYHPPYIFNSDRPVLISAPAAITFRQYFTVQYDVAGTVPLSARLVAPSSTTHSTNFHQRVIGLRVVSTDYKTGLMQLEGPPDANVAQQGMFMLFLLRGYSYSTSQWVLLQ